MTYNTNKKSDKTLLSALLTEDILRNVESMDSPGFKSFDENIPVIDIGKNLSADSRALLERTAGITRSYNLPEINLTHLMLALMHDAYLVSIFEKYSVDSENLKQAFNATVHKGELVAAEIRRIDLVLAPEVERVLKDSLLTVADLGESLIEPHHLFVTILKKDYSPISQVIRTEISDINNLIYRIKDENNQSYRN